MNSDFNFFVPIDLDIEKAKEQVGKGYDNMIVEGIASDTSVDTDEEILEPSGFELDRFLKLGFINFDHRSKDDPQYLIGEPISARVEGNKFIVKGKLYKEREIARNLYDTMKILKSSGSKRKIGWSIEGKAIERHPSNPKRITKALITGIALTPNPKNGNSYADIVKGTYSEPLKAHEFEFEFSNGGNVEYLAEFVDKEKGIRYVVDKNLKLVEKAISSETAKPLMKESLEGKKKHILNLANAVSKGLLPLGILKKAKENFNI